MPLAPITPRPLPEALQNATGEERGRYWRHYREAFSTAFDGDHRVCDRCGQQGCNGYMGHIDALKPSIDTTGAGIWGGHWPVVVQTCRHCGVITFFAPDAFDFPWHSDASLLNPDPPPTA